MTAMRRRAKRIILSPMSLDGVPDNGMPFPAAGAAGRDESGPTSPPVAGRRESGRESSYVLDRWSRNVSPRSESCVAAKTHRQEDQQDDSSSAGQSRAG